MKKIIVAKATWCMPCKSYSPILEEARSSFKEKGYELEFKDVDEESEWTQKYSIRGVPTTLIFNDEIVVKSLVGKRTKEEILAELI